MSSSTSRKFHVSRLRSKLMTPELQLRLNISASSRADANARAMLHVSKPSRALAQHNLSFESSPQVWQQSSTSRRFPYKASRNLANNSRFASLVSGQPSPIRIRERKRNPKVPLILS